MKACFSASHLAGSLARVFKNMQLWCVFGLLLLCPDLVRAQSWQVISASVGNRTFYPAMPILLTDGTVICQSSDNGFSTWWKLTPSLFGDYVAGTWTQIASMPGGYQGIYYSSAVLADGRVVVLSNSSTGDRRSFLYDPVKNTWTSLAPPAGWGGIGVATCAVLPDGRLLVVNPYGSGGAILDTSTLTWTLCAFTGKADANLHEGWTLLPDGTLLTVDVTKNYGAETYNPLTDTWSNAGNTKQLLTYSSAIGYSIGPQVLRPDGTVIAFGVPGNSSIYDSMKKSWSYGPSFPSGQILVNNQPVNGTWIISAGPACLLPNGRVLVGANFLSEDATFSSNLAMFEGDSFLVNRIPFIDNFYTSNARMLMLPTGQVMLTAEESQVWIYNTDSGPINAWRPTITSSPPGVSRGGTYSLSGTQFNGLSQASVMSASLTNNATNYPLVRITYRSNGHRAYFRTHDHSTMGVATGSTPVSTRFDVPSNAELGAADLVVVANGIASASVPITVALAPFANSQRVSVSFNTAKGITLAGSDFNTPALALTYTLSTAPTHGTLTGFNPSTGAVTYTPNAGYHGSDLFNFTTTNSVGLTSSSGVVLLQVDTGVPSATDQTANVVHNTATEIDLKGSDPDIPVLPLTFTVTSLPTHGTLSPVNAATGAVIYTPSPNTHGSDSFTFKVSNGTNTSAMGTVTLNVLAGNPTANGQTVSTNQDTELGITLTASDLEIPALPLTFLTSALPSHGHLRIPNFGSDTLIYIPDDGYWGPDSFEFRVTNGPGESTSATVNINVAQTLFDVTGQVAITRGVFTYQRATNTYTQVLTLKNIGNSPLSTPIWLILSNLANATLTNADGMTRTILPAGRPYRVNYGVPDLAPGATTTMTLSFAKTGAGAITYTPQVLAGPGSY